MHEYGAFETKNGWLGYYQYWDYNRRVWVTKTVNAYAVNESSAIILAIAASKA